MNFISGAWNLFFEKLYSIVLRQMNFGRAAAYRNNGELHSLRQLARRWTKGNLTLFDVGANVGEFSMEILEAFRNKSFQLYAFEPSAHTGEKFKQRVGNAGNIRLIQSALSDHVGTADLFFPKEGASTLASLYQRDLAHINAVFNGKEQVPITTLDNFCEQNKIDFIHLLKLDVEGHELSVLKGAEQMLKRDAIEVIQFEFGGSNIDSRTYFKDFYQLLSSKYKIYRILPKGLRELPAYSETLEIFQSANYLAVHK